MYVNNVDLKIRSDTFVQLGATRAQTVESGRSPGSVMKLAAGLTAAHSRNYKHVERAHVCSISEGAAHMCLMSHLCMTRTQTKYKKKRKSVTASKPQDPQPAMCFLGL